MNVAFLLYPDVVISNRSNGIRSQAIRWANLLEEEGIHVDYINNWDNYNWKKYDIIHLFGGGLWIYRMAELLYPINNNLVWSPICDPVATDGFSLSKKIKKSIKSITSGVIKWDYLYSVGKLGYVKKVFARTLAEKEYLNRFFNVPIEIIEIVPLSYSETCVPFEPIKKENVCLHISSIYQERKNVKRLIEASQKYNFKLILAGNKGTDEQFGPLKEAIGNSTNICVKGFISEEEKIELYKRCKVFALPSISEGVGIVALDAAYYGCEIAITNIPGPKEYYKGMCAELNPFDVDSIGQKIDMLLGGSLYYQPQLSEIVAKTFSGKAISYRLINAYDNLLMSSQNGKRKL